MLVQSENERIKRIRISERNSHTEIYLNEELYKSDSWLNKPIKTVVDLIPCFKDYKTLNVLDLGCGVGRNCIAVAQAYKNIVCNVDCVDLLELAIEKLCEMPLHIMLKHKFMVLFNLLRSTRLKKKSTILLWQFLRWNILILRIRSREY